jgi:hypothetical protein
MCVIFLVCFENGIFLLLVMFYNTDNYVANFYIFLLYNLQEVSLKVLLFIKSFMYWLTSFKAGVQARVSRLE